MFKNDFKNGYNYTHTGNFHRAVLHLSKIKDLETAVRDYVLFYLGKALLGEGRCLEARSVFEELIRFFPESRWVPIAEAHVKGSDPCALLSLLPTKTVIRCEDQPVMDDRAECFFQKRRYTHARDLFRELAGQAPSLLRLTRLSQSAARSQDFPTAIWANEEILKIYPKGDTAEEALRKIAFLRQDSGNYSEAIPVLQELLSGSLTQSERRLFLERLGWATYRLGRFQEALQHFEAGLEVQETPFLLYWKGRTLERLERVVEAREVFRFLASLDEGNYYGTKASERLSGRQVMPSWFQGKRIKIRWGKSEEGYEDSLDLRRIWELSLLGLKEDASVEIRRARSRLKILLPNSPEKIRKKNNVFFWEARRVKSEDPEFPLPYADFLLSELKRMDSTIDPFLLYAMMRQESRFRDSSVSSAGAVGILQILPATGQRLASEAQWIDFRTEWLQEPITNIELAVHYVATLAKLFRGKWYLVVSSYNAGEDVVRRWAKQRSHLTEEEFIEEIPYQETRDYVKKVYANWKVYRALYRLP